MSPFIFFIIIACFLYLYIILINSLFTRNVSFLKNRRQQHIHKL
ncbi:hypothetical protein ANACAC_03724 [Anaerostipes caccae L1-92]|uniref:Uncharacterized protein n=1 Tax=Anaerostipes caccae (strain DSM 14662 / CCUG 47493 / JCM 13470 / NCIMB 13811 / L1-92) TaxID=411490 RepID=B0MJB2_ANACD|nr:hypothetical protein ANACAC_03724 [Anaerostipes caccae L1-92]